jgi:hypothetical protein
MWHTVLWCRLRAVSIPVQSKIKKFHYRMLYCSAVHLVWTSFALDFGLKLNSFHGSDFVYSILSPEWNADKTRIDKVRYWDCSRLFRGIDLCRLESMEEADLWRRLDLVMVIPVTTYQC